MSKDTEHTLGSHATPRDAVKYDLLATVIKRNIEWDGADYTDVLLAVIRTLRDAADAELRDAIFDVMAAFEVDTSILGGAE